MNLVRYNYQRPTPFLTATHRGCWNGLEAEINRLFESTLSASTAPAFGPRFPVDLYEDKDNTYVRAELPGLAREDINVEVVDGYLSIEGTRKVSDGEGKPVESHSLNRSIALPDSVQADQVAATYENGVLTVTLPKREEAKPKKITVEIK